MSESYGFRIGFPLMMVSMRKDFATRVHTPRRWNSGENIEDAIFSPFEKIGNAIDAGIEVLHSFSLYVLSGVFEVFTVIFLLN